VQCNHPNSNCKNVEWSQAVRVNTIHKNQIPKYRV